MVKSSEKMTWASVWKRHWKVAKTWSWAIIGQHDMVVAWLGVLAPEMEIKRMYMIQREN